MGRCLSIEGKSLELKTIRSALFVPATKVDWIDKAAASDTDLVIVDLEDAVSESRKDEARHTLAGYLARYPQRQIVVRTNSADSFHFDADMKLCQAASGIVGVMLPKAESYRHVDRAASANKPIIPLIESAKGVVNLHDICRHDRVDRLSLGTLDLSESVGLANDTAEAVFLHNWVRAQIVTATSAFGLNLALDGVFTAIADAPGLRQHVERARNFGFGGVLCIHPSQLRPVQEAFKPSPEELAWARRVVAAMQGDDGAVALDGEMVDAPVLARAKRLLSS